VSHPSTPIDRVPRPATTWRRLAVTVLFAVGTLVAADRVAWWLAPPAHLREVEDAMRELETGDPTVLAIGSSHGRTFAVIDDSIRARSAGRERILAVPVEWGKLTAYAWVLRHRLLPVLDETDADGRPRRRSLRRAIIITEWWDSCPYGSPLRNLPARSWTWQHYIADVRQHGLTAYNNNFLGYRWSRFWHGSALVQDRGQRRLLTAVRQRLAPASAEAQQANFEVQTAMWRKMVEDGASCIGSAPEMDALDWMVDTLQARGLEVTVLLYPRMPATLSERAKATTLPQFAELVRAAVGPKGVSVIDLTTSAPLTDADFGADFDHIVRAGNARLAGWALDGPFRFLLESRP